MIFSFKLEWNCLQYDTIHKVLVWHRTSLIQQTLIDFEAIRGKNIKHSSLQKTLIVKESVKILTKKWENILKSYQNLLLIDQ